MSTTRQQQRAVASHDLVEAARQTGNWDNYRTFCMKGPTLLQQSGLMQTTVFCSSRSDDGARAWIGDVARVMNAGRPAEGRSLAERARTAPLAEYLALTRDAIDAATWLRRYAMAFAQDDDAPAGQGGG